MIEDYHFIYSQWNGLLHICLPEPPSTTPGVMHICKRAKNPSGPSEKSSHNTLLLPAETSASGLKQLKGRILQPERPSAKGLRSGCNI